MTRQPFVFKPTKAFWMWLSVAVIMIGAVAILSHADELGLWFDELWTVFHSSTSITQILAERDVTWPPGSFLVLHTWAHFASWNDFSLHMLGVFMFLLSTAFLIRAGRYFGGWNIGLLAALAFATSGYVLYFSLEVRGYTQMLMLECAFVVCYLRWLKRPSLKRSIPLLLVQIAMLYIQFILGLVIVLSFIHLLFSAPRKIWRWLIIAAITGIAFLPMLDQFQKGFQLRTNLHDLPNYFKLGLDSFYRAFSSYNDLVFGLILILALIGLLAAVRKYQWSKIGATLVWLVLWGIAIPIYAYITREKSGMWTTRYLTFVIPAIFLLIGIGLASLPIRWSGLSLGGWISAALLLMLAITPWHPYDHRPKPSDNGAPIHQFVRAMAQRWQQGDKLVIDPNFHEFGPLEASYYQLLYFPTGQIPTAKDGTEAGRRIWYLVRQGTEDAAVKASVEKDHIKTDNFWGPWYFIATLYEGAPNTNGIHFGDTLRFHGADIERRHALHAGDIVPITLWWSVDKPTPPELSMSIQLLDPNGKAITSLDGFPKTVGTPEQLDQWQPNMLYLDKRTLEIPYQLQPGIYTIHLVVYRWQDGTRLPPETGATPDKTLIIDTVELSSFAVW